MANYPKELTDLVEEYLTDGIISTKERQVLLKKAQQLGVDVDEFDLYIDAQQQKADQQVDAASRKQRGKTCPFCGGVVPQLTDKCPHCGETITAEASEELQEIFDHLEEALVDFKSGKEIAKSKAVVERYVRKAKMYYENNPKVQKLLLEVQQESEKALETAKKNARNRTVVSVLTYNKKLTFGIAIGLIIAVIWGISTIWSIIKGTDKADDPVATIEAVKQAISSGDISKAELYCAAYYNIEKHYKSDIKAAYDAIALAYVDKGEYQKALEYCVGSSREDEEGDGLYRPDAVRTKIQKLCIEAGDYALAEQCFDYVLETGEYFDFVCMCIDNMKKNGDVKSTIKSFIDRKIRHYVPCVSHKAEWQQPAVKKRLYEYAGI